ncbi:hypothetical protein [Plantactinospora sonchi]|uniref:Uncharacterized protein n=1 Tax=Plantactinospora sonchi TaxID=1544735 RepID=A0ABU7RWU3_9ACTN
MTRRQLAQKIRDALLEVVYMSALCFVSAILTICGLLLLGVLGSVLSGT